MHIVEKLKIMNLILMIVFVSHWLGCVWIYVGFGRDDGNTWIDKAVRRKALVENRQIPATAKDLPTSEVYLTTMYLAVRALVGGYLPADPNSAEMVLGCFTATFTVLAFGGIIGTLTELVRR